MTDKQQAGETIHVTFTTDTLVWRRRNGIDVPAPELDRSKSPFVRLRDGKEWRACDDTGNQDQPRGRVSQ